MQCDSPPVTKLQTGDLDIHTDRIPHQSVVITKPTHRSEPGKKKKSLSTRKRDLLRLIKWRASRHGKQQSTVPKPIPQEDGPVAESTPPTTPIGNISVDNTVIPMEYEVNSSSQIPPTLLTGKLRPTTPDSRIITSQNSTDINQQQITETKSALTLRETDLTLMEEGLEKLEQEQKSLEKQQMYDLELLRHAEKLAIIRTSENLMCFNCSKPGLESPGALKRCVKFTCALYCSKNCQDVALKVCS